MSITKTIFDRDDLRLHDLEVDVEEEIVPTEQNTESPSAATRQERYMLVSSKHLKLASSVYKAMLQPNFLEGVTLHAHTHSQAEIDMPDDNPFAFPLLMRTIHGPSRQLPSKISSKDLAELSILADKYQTDSLDSYAQLWALELRI